MKKSALIIVCYLFTFHCATRLIDKTINPWLLNRSVNRTFYTKNQLLHIDYEILMEYHGNTSAVGFIFSVESILANNVMHLEAVQLDSFTESKLRIQEVNVENLSGVYWFIGFKHPLLNRQSVRLKTSAVLARCLRPLPAYINQEEAQLVVLHASHYFYSAYCTDQQVTVVKLPSFNVESYSIIQPTKKYLNTISYGPYRGISAFNTSDMRIHFEYNAAFLTVKSLKRVIKISPWGNIAVAERIRLQNTGAALKGPFSRYVYMMHRGMSDTASANNITPVLPKSANNIYYIDDLGNISTSHVLNTEDSINLTLEFRYPLLGGWNISLIIGYDVPASEYVFHIEDDYVLHMPLINNLYEGKIQANIICYWTL
ncbi:dolichyl-diphosphooligosaccharide--protein glycosyltransferase subunit 1-like [Schistocerca cancellata]|uniref:dolichyl-diphosphooligosaccharide--protein glycosyltransferase subunit 1-like n=1 Tax=Schistocerca cancellata TaxID=274614 RepID=UPI00211939E7|nr:dolichyl-diphosphooligosaccharide--protein glycosyltransferase subunit 1-like [Schistocerca cancellata]